MPSPSAAAISSASAVALIMVPVGLAGLATSTPCSGLLRCAAISASAVSAWRLRSIRLDQHRLAAERRQDVAIGWIAGHRDRHPVAGIEQRQERQDEAAGRAGGHDDTACIERQSVCLAIILCNARPQ